VARMGTGEVHTGFWLGNLGGKRPLRRPRCRCRVILRWVFRKCDVGAWTGLIWFSTVTVGGLL